MSENVTTSGRISIPTFNFSGFPGWNSFPYPRYICMHVNILKILSMSLGRIQQIFYSSAVQSADPDITNILLLPFVLLHLFHYFPDMIHKDTIVSSFKSLLPHLTSATTSTSFESLKNVKSNKTEMTSLQYIYQLFIWFMACNFQCVWMKLILFHYFHSRMF